MADDCVIDIESGESETEAPVGDPKADAQANVAAEALAQEPVQERLACKLMLPPRKGLSKPYPIGYGGVALDGPAEELVLWTVPTVEASQFVVRVPVASVTGLHVHSEGRVLVLSIAPALMLIAEGFLAEQIAALRYEEAAANGAAEGEDDGVGEEGEDPNAALRVPTLGLFFAQAWVRPALATLKAWLPQLQIYGPRSLGLLEFVPLRFQTIVLTETENALLAEEQWLNDTAMDFFLRLAVELAGPDELRGEVYLASTQFFSRLSGCGAHSGEKGWENVRTWTRSVAGGAVAKRYLVYPVNEDNLHWWVALVCKASEAMEESPASGLGPDDDGPRIVCLDSAFEAPPKGPHMEMLKGYLRRELFNQPGPKADVSDPAELMAQVARWKASVIASERMRVCVAESPQQQNPHDCGVFVIEFLLHLFREPDRFQSLGLGSHADWFDQALVTHRRARMREIVALLQKVAPQGARELEVSALLQNDQELRARVSTALLDLPEDGPSPEYDYEEPPPFSSVTDFAPHTAATTPAGDTEAAAPWKRLRRQSAIHRSSNGF